MRDSKVYYADRSERVTANEMEMALQEFCEDAWQYYYQDVDKWFGGQIMSKAIKCPAPIFVKYNNSSKLFDFYYWDRLKRLISILHQIVVRNSLKEFIHGQLVYCHNINLCGSCCIRNIFINSMDL